MNNPGQTFTHIHIQCQAKTQLKQRVYIQALKTRDLSTLTGVELRAGNRCGVWPRAELETKTKAHERCKQKHTTQGNKEAKKDKDV